MSLFLKNSYRISALCLWLCFMATPANAMEQDRQGLLSRESLTNMLMDLKMARNDLSRSKNLKKLEMFSYRTMEADLEVIIGNVERYLYPKVKHEFNAVPIRLDGRYFSEALQNNLIIRGKPDVQASTSMSINDLPSVDVDSFGADELAYLDGLSDSTTIVVVQKDGDVPKVAPKAQESVRVAGSKDQVKAPKVQESVRVADTKDQAKDTYNSEIKAVLPDDVILAWEHNYNHKNLKDMMRLYSVNFRGKIKEKNVRRKDFAKEFMAYPDGKISIYNLEVKRNEQTRDFIVTFDADLTGKQWAEFTSATFLVDKNLKIIDETWVPSMPIEDGFK